MAKSKYEVYLHKCLLPITPESLELKINNANKTITLMDEQQINVLKKAELTDIEFECMIPQMRYPFAVYKSGFQGASYFLGYFELLKNSKKPFQFIVNRMTPDGKVLFDTNMTVSLEEYQIKENVKNGFDLIIKIKLKQYCSYCTKTVHVSLNSPNQTASVTNNRIEDNTPKSAQDYTVKKGDCLWNIAKKYYGSGAKYTIIFDANKGLVSNPNLIYPGQVLTIPAQ